MNSNPRRDFLKILAVAAGSGLLCDSMPRAQAAAGRLYDPPQFGNIRLLHFSDTHAQLLPSHYREADCHIGVGRSANETPYLVGESLLEYFGIRPQSIEAHAFTHLHFEDAAQIYGSVGGYAHLYTLLDQLRAERPDSLTFDSGDTLHGSALSLWTQGRDMAEVTRRMRVDAMTGDWDFALGAKRLMEIVRTDFKDGPAFLAQNVVDAVSGERVFAPSAIYVSGGVQVGVIGEAFPQVGVFSGRDFAPDWRFGVNESELQAEVLALRAKGARIVVLLSHAGMPADLKIAARVTGIDVVLGGHSHDVVPEPVVVKNRSGRTLVTNAGSGGKFVGVLDLKVKAGRLLGYQYRLLPVFAKLVAADADIEALIRKLRKPHAAELGEVLATTEGMLYRRGNFNGTFDQLILDGVRSVKGVEIAMAPGFRWGPTLLPGAPITIERVFDQTAVPSPGVVVESLTGSEIMAILESGADRVFNADPYLQSGEDMIRVAGLNYRVNPGAEAGHRISSLQVGEKPAEAGRRYRVATWGLGRSGRAAEPIWQVVGRYLRQRRSIGPIEPYMPELEGVADNRGIG